ncbi:MAG: hypothetical protein AAF462_03640 [Thermodesulfobacteriota bacterium]
MYRWTLLIIPIFFLASCGGGMQWKRPLQEKQSAKAAYEQCLIDYPDNQMKCDAYKDAYNDSIRQMKGANEDPHSDDGLYGR